MADNSVLNDNTTTGDTYRSVDKSGVKSQVVILDLGGGGTENIGAVAGTAGSPATAVLSVQGVASGTAIPISAASLPLPSGGSTLAEQQSQTTLLGTIDTDTGTISTNSGTIAAGYAAEGSALGSGVLLQGDDGTDRTNVLVDTDGHLQIDVLTMPTVTVSATNLDIRDLTSASDSVAAVCTNAGTFAVQAAQSGTWTVDLGATDNAVLDAIAASLAGTLTVAGAVTNAGTFAVQAAQSGTWTVQPGNTANTTAWLVTGTGGTFPVSGVAAHGAAVSGNPVLLAGENPLGNVARLQTATDGDLIVHQHSDTVSLADDISNTPQVTINEDDAGILYTPTVGFMFDGTGWDRIRGTSADGLLVNLGSNNDVTITSGTVTTLANGQTAHDSAVTGSPLRVGAKAETALSGITLVADGDATDLHAGVDGVLITRPHCNLEDIVSGVAAITDGSSTSVIAAAGAGVKIYITSVIIANSSATAVSVDIRDGAAGTVKATFPAPPDMGGVVHALPVPLPFTANTAVCADPSASASTITCTLIGFKSKV